MLTRHCKLMATHMRKLIAKNKHSMHLISARCTN